MALLTSSWKLDFVALCVALFTVLYLFVRRTYSYWERRGFATVPDASQIFGHFKNSLLQKEYVGNLAMRLYKSTNEPFVGIYSILRPVLLIRDPELVQTILIKDFPNFMDRGVYSNAKTDPLSGHLFSLPGQPWKTLRGKLSPTFTSGKLKAMFSTLINCGSSLQSFLENVAKEGKLLDTRDLAARHTTNVIASVGFGIDVDTIAEPNNEFRKYGRKIFEPNVMNAIRFFLKFIAPEVMEALPMKSHDAKVEEFFRSVVKQNLEHREKNNVTRKDFFQLLIQLRNTGTVQLDDQWETVIKADDNQKTLTEDEILAQTFVFFGAGFETSSTTLSFCLYQLSKYPEIQARVHSEIDKVLKEHNGQVTYESIADMKYLDCCIDGVSSFSIRCRLIHSY